MRTMYRRAAAGVAAVVCLTALHAAAGGAVIANGDYTLHNHADGAVNPPPYGARFDEIVNATADHDVFTLDFDHVQSLVTMSVTPSVIHIFGQARGGRDVGADYANDGFLGLYTIDFTFAAGVATVPGDDDVWVTGSLGHGTISGPGIGTVALQSREQDGYAFRLGDEDSDAGHRGFAGLSGWGWMDYVRPGVAPVHVDATDWLFTATRNIPAPGSAALVGVGMMVVSRRRSRK